MSAEFEFVLRYTDRDVDPYYYTNWDRGGQMSVRGASKQEAINKADAALGSAGSGRYWVFRVLKMQEVVR